MLTSAWLSSARHRPAAAPGPVLSALVACCAVLSAGCGEDMGPDRARPEPAYVIGIRPAPGATIFPDGKVVVVFNRDPGDVQCEGGRLDPDGQVGTVRTYRMEWGGTISFAWPDDGSLTVAYSPLGCVGEGGGGDAGRRDAGAGRAGLGSGVAGERDRDGVRRDGRAR